MSNRDVFLLKLYEICWNNVTKAEDSIWKIFAAYTAILAGLGLAIDAIGALGFLLLVITFSFIGMYVSINASSWFARNMGLIANLEKEFLDKGDFDKIIPKKWVTSKVPFLNLEVWWIMFFLFIAVIMVSTYLFYNTISEEGKTIVFFAEVIGFLLAFGYGVIKFTKHSDFVTDAKGKDISN